MDVLSRDIVAVGPSFSTKRALRYWWLPFLGLAIGALGGWTLTASQSEVYASTTSVLVLSPPQGVTLSSGRANGDVNMDTEIQLARSNQVAATAHALLRSTEDVEAVRDRLSVTVPPNTRILSIGFKDATPESAQQGSHAFAQAYITERTSQSKADVSAQGEALSKQIAALNARLVQVTGKIAALEANSPDRALAEAEQSILVNSLSNLNQRLAPLTADLPAGGTIINDAQRPARPSSPIPVMNIGGGAMLGLLVGLGLALLAGRRDDLVRGANDVETRAGQPVLASIHGLGRHKVPFGIVAGRTGGQDFDRLRLHLDASASAKSSVLVCGSTSGRATSFVAANLATSQARTGRRVTLVCVDPDSRIPEILELEGTRGLADVLRGEADLAAVVQDARDVPGLRVVAPGRDLQLAFENVPRHRVARIAQAFMERDWVVVETAPVIEGVEAEELAQYFDTVVVVVEGGRSRVSQVTRSFAALDQVGAHVSGAVVVPDLSHAPTQSRSLEAALQRPYRSTQPTARS